MQKCYLKGISIPKQGHSESENEDNYLLPSSNEVEKSSVLKCAVADGATESSFSKEWSDLLVSGFKDMSFAADQISTTLDSLSQSWQQRTNSKELPWYAQQKLEDGAFAAFLGVSIDMKKKQYKAIAIGDCTLFHFSKKKINSFPLTKSEDYGNTPYLISSNLKNNSKLQSFIRTMSGKLKKGDSLILATDAISAWIFTELESGRQPLTVLLEYIEKPVPEFENWINLLRSEKVMKNDDVTILHIHIQ